MSGGGLAAPRRGGLWISELLINPAGTDTGREWIEVENVSDQPLDLSALHVADRLADAAVDWGALSPRLERGACAVLVQSADPTKNGGIAALPGVLLGSFGTRVSLNNEADTISLCVGPCGSATPVDSVDRVDSLDNVEWKASLGADYDGHAVSRDAWGRVCPATQPFGNAGSFGTPGAPNPPCP